MTELVVDCHGFFRIYKNINVGVVQGLDIRMEEGEMIVVVGRSGSGKTTLLKAGA